MRWFGRFLYEHPFVRALGGVTTTLGGAFLATWFLSEITDVIIDEAGKQRTEWVWTKALQTWATLVIVAYALLFSAYYWGLSKFDTKKWNDPEYVRARATAELWPDLRTSIRQSIRDGTITTLDDIRNRL